AGYGARQPGSARRARRPAGPAAPRARAVPRRPASRGGGGLFGVCRSTRGRAAHEATTHRGPAIVIVPMDDWGARADPEREDAAPERVVRATAADPEAVAELAPLLGAADAPALV